MSIRTPVARARGADELTSLLHAWSQGDLAAFARLWSIIYDELRQLARRRRRRRREYCHDAPETTVLVHEAYLRLADERAISPKSRAHFFAIAARVMRCPLIDAARSRNAQKRARGAGDFQRQDDLARQEAIDSVEFTDALHRLAAHDERQAASSSCASSPDLRSKRPQRRSAPRWRP